MKKLLSLILCLVLLSSVLVACEPSGCAHRYVNGTCTLCQEADPNYTPAQTVNPSTPCAHRYVNGTCTLCQETDPNYTPAQTVNPSTPCAHHYVNGVCANCQAQDSSYVANTPINPSSPTPTAHNYVDGVCTICQAPQPGYVAPTYPQGALAPVGNGKYVLADENGNYGGTRDRGRYGDGAPLNGMYDQVNSTWYETNRDFYNMKSTKLADGTAARTIYTGFAPYQQTMANTSGIAGMVAVLNYWGEAVSSETELELFNKYQEVNKVTLSGRETAQGLINVWTSLNYQAELSTLKRNSTRATAAKEFMAWIQEQLSAGKMVFVHYHDNEVARWKVIIGFDTMDNGTDQYYDDMLIFADSYDNYDHYQDGYSTVCATQFVQWWLDLNEKTGSKITDYEAVVVSPKQPVTITRVLASEDAAQVGYTSVPENHLVLNWGQSEDREVSGTLIPGLTAGSYGGHYVEVNGNKVTDYGGGTCMNGKRDHHQTHNYYKHPDYYNIQPVANSRWYLSGYRAYQQTMASSCGHCTAFSILNYYGFDFDAYNEITLVHAYEAMHKKVENVSSYTHVSKEGYSYIMTPALESMGVKGVTSKFQIVSNSRFASKNIDPMYLGRSFNNQEEFFAFVKENLAKGQPVGISWRPNGGHWTAIIGYDDVGTPNYIYDDVIVFADSGDTWDHYQEGFNVFPATLVYRHWWSLRFDYTQDWFVIDRAANGK